MPLNPSCPYLPTATARCLYEHHPRPKEFIVLYRIPEVLKHVLLSQGRGSDAVHQEAQRLMTAFNYNVLL